MTISSVVPRGTAIGVSNLGWPVEPRHGFNNALEALLQQLRIAETINLLQGRHSPKRNRLRWFAPWKLAATLAAVAVSLRSEEHTSELQSLMRISYAVFCLKKKNTNEQKRTTLNL